MSKYIAWIPTNSGLLSQEYVLSQHPYEKVKVEDAEKVYCLTQEALSFSDTIDADALKEELGFYFVFEIDFSNDEWKFKLHASPDDDRKVELFNAIGTIESNGKIVFDLTINSQCGVCASDKNCHGESTIPENLPNTVFTFVKRQIHTDLHHSEKVDNVIPVLPEGVKVEEWTKVTSEALVAKIKSIEFDAKRIYRDQSLYVKYKKNQELLKDAEGFLAYLQSFVHLFDLKNEPYIKRAGFVLDSLRALNGKVLVEKQRRDQYGSIFATSIALFVSLNIMIRNNALHIPKDSNFGYTLLVLFVVVVFASVLDVIYFGSSSLMYVRPIQKAQEYYQRVYLTAIKRENFRKIGLKHKLMYLFLRYGAILFAVLGLWGSVRFLSHFL